MNPPIRIAVFGPHECGAEDYALGEAVGAEIARRKAVLICGGLGGMMEAAARGARGAGGRTVGILPGENSDDANPYIEVAIPTALGPFRNALLARAADAAIAIRGGYGTLSEIAFALRLDVPVIGLRSWSVSQDGRVDPGIRVAVTPAEAVDLALRYARQPR